MINLELNRGMDVCRICESKELVSILDLGLHPVPSHYGIHPDEDQEKFPLNLKICKLCGLGQIGEFVSREYIFHGEYPYISSASATWLQHTKDYAKNVVQSLNLPKGSFVLEIASNDGSLLSEFKNMEMQVLGVEPAKSVANIAITNQIPTIIDFFGEELAREILFKYGYPRLIIANNVFAHVPNMQDFTIGLSILSNKDTTITIENPSFLNLLKNNLFDTIYHEHYSYLSTHSIEAVSGKFGLVLYRVEALHTHGGSNRYWLSKSGRKESSVVENIEVELSQGIFDSTLWSKFSVEATKLISGLRDWLELCRNKDLIVVGYGAAHKGNTFLNSVGKASKYIRYVVDASPEKHGKYLPGSKILVLPPEKLNSASPTDVLILPWNLEKELSERVKSIAPEARIWVAHPSIHQVGTRLK